MTTSQLMFIHAPAGLIALLSGVGALMTVKGSTQHRLLGKIFGVSMLLMCASAVYIAYLNKTMDSLFVGLMTFYLVATAWDTAASKEKMIGMFHYVALVYALLVGISALLIELQKADPDAPSLYGVVIVSILVIIGDVRMIVQRGIVGAQRLARHLWRMCLALLLAVISFAFQVQKTYPLISQEAALLIPGTLVLVTMLYWLFRVLFRKSVKTQ